ncbi:uncharacterized protein EKO05_0005569 [Ascochyta rabiei]|uniref:uncharacterized protein n=1 Tax=Didymella rabiei TaxID=5454 RepID=UPI00220729E3|nr:uncharacterized protein EKO05_0005569 [Ascochyta rabiei]UPX15110.1 hypothetical protein EKO05_0005569 [Ascochyta rabiei]
MASQTTTSHTVYRRISSDSRLEPCWQLIETWLSTCTSNHPACSHNQHPEWPTRLLNVEDLRIVNGSTCGGHVRYATLSHCWGTSMFTRLNKSAFQGFMTGIDHQILPRNFQDAIFATRRLEITYQWIDALCVIQDSHAEWAKELVNMGKYYGHAVVILSALSSPSSNTGFLGPRNPQPLTSLQNRLHLRKARPSWNNVFTGAPLTERAWILQERLISLIARYSGNV